MFTTRRASFIGSLFVFLVLVACGGGGGGDSTPAPVTPPAQSVIAYASDYWQAADGSLWLYEGHDATVGTYYRNRATLGRPMSLAGRTLTRFEYTNMLNDGMSPQYRSFGSEGIRSYLEVAPSDPAYSYIELRAEIRRETYRAFDTGEEPIQGGTMRIMVDVTVHGFEPLTLPGGVFAQTLRSTHTVTATITTSTGTGVGQSTIDYWYAKGIGVVKQVLTDPNYPAGSNTYTEELAGVMTTNIKAGVVGEFALLQNSGSGNSALTTGRPGIASDGAGFLVVAHTTLNERGQLVATYVEPNGTARFTDRVIVADLGNGMPTSSTMEYGPIHVAWDGSRFWVVAEGSFGGVVRQRVSPDGSVHDGPNGATLNADGRQPAVAIEGGTALVAYASYQVQPYPGWALYASAYALDGSVKADAQLLAATGLNGSMPSVTAHANEFLVTFEAGAPADVMAVRVGASGMPLDPAPIMVSAGTGAQWGSEVAGWGGSNFVAVWQDSLSPSQNNILAARMTSTGTLVDGSAANAGVLMCNQPTERFGTAAADGVQGTLLGWTVGSYYSNGQALGIYGRLFRPGADLVPGSAVRLGLLTQQDYATRLMYPAAAASADGFMVAWVYNSEGMTGAMKTVRGVLVFPRYGT